MTEEGKEKSELKPEMGIIKAFYAQAGYGFITGRKGKKDDLFFHVSDLSDFTDGPPLESEHVSFIRKETEKGPAASDIKRKRSIGMIVRYDRDKAFGFISQGGRLKDRFFHISDFIHSLSAPPARNDYVVFTEKQGKMGPAAGSVRRTTRSVGKITQYGRTTGKVQLEGSKKALKFKISDIVQSRFSPKPSEVGEKPSFRFRGLSVGDSVSFVLNDEGKPICVNYIYPLHRFANLGNEDDLFENLAELALPEEWDYPGTRRRRKHSILRNYLFYTFERLETEDEGLPEERKKIRIASSEGEPDVAVFDTGLVNRVYEPLYGVFKKKEKPVDGRPQWNFVGFCVPGGRIKTEGEWTRGENYLSYFRELPSRAEYFKNPSELLYDPNKRLDPVTEHIIGERGERLPEAVRKRVPPDMSQEEIHRFLAGHLRMAIKRAQQRIKWNYKAAIPQYYPKRKKMQLLLPLCIDDPRKVDVALAVETERETYVGNTILDLEMAYINARLIAKPDSDWLTPRAAQEAIDEEFGDDSEDRIEDYEENSRADDMIED